MQLDEALALLPNDSPYRVVLRSLVATDEAAREPGLRALRGMSRPYWEPPVVVAEPVALAVLRAALELSFPPRERDWDPGAEQVVFTLVGSATPKVIAWIEERYASCNESMRLHLLTVVASAGTREGSEFFARAVATYGWPRRLFGRIFSELSRNVPHAEVLFPTILDAAHAPAIEVGDLLLQALRSGSLAKERMDGSAFARALPSRLDALLGQLPALRDRAADDLTDEERNVGAELAMLLDLAGYLGSEEVVTALHRASALPETWPASFAIASLLARGITVEDAAIARVARDAVALPAFYQLLQARGSASRIPAELRSRDAFARADMVQWLAHPGELGHPPDALEQMAVLEAVVDEQPIVLYVFRFRDDGAWKAAVSGPYPRDPAEGPLHGNSTFSRFEAWDSKSPEGHANAILETLAEWKRAKS